MESTLQPINKTENLERKPKVEHLFFRDNKDVLIKTSFPMGDAIAYCYILVFEPSSKEGADRVKAYKETLEDEKARRVIDIGFEASNSPLVFKGIEQVQEWFDMTKYNFDKEERMKVAAFLEIDDKE